MFFVYLALPETMQCSEIGLLFNQHIGYLKKLFHLDLDGGNFLKHICLQIIRNSFLGLGLSQALCPGSM